VADVVLTDTRAYKTRYGAHWHGFGGEVHHPTFLGLGLGLGLGLRLGLGLGLGLELGLVSWVVNFSTSAHSDVTISKFRFSIDFDSIFSPK